MGCITRRLAISTSHVRKNQQNPFFHVLQYYTKYFIKRNSVGVSLGTNEKEIMVSTNALKHMEFDHVKVTPRFLSKSNTTHLDE
jgi:hypothetical protein